MPFRADNAAFEAWLRTKCAVVEGDLDRKHDRMKLSPFIFLRATFFRWAKRIEWVCPDLADAPQVLSVGDTHVENFGTWRDAEGRLVWGVNDFDEAASIPYPFDLVRLAASIRLAPEMKVANRDVAAALLGGYRKGLTDRRPTLLDEQEIWMRPYVAVSDKKRRKFWHDVENYPEAFPPTVVVDGLGESLPKGAVISKFAARLRGGGSLGRPRYVAVADWCGGKVVREAKALVPSAWDWAHGRLSAPSRFLELARGRYRSPDPFLDMGDCFVFRRIAADSRKVELADEDGMELRLELFRAMGFDLGAIHAADQNATGIEADLSRRPDDWLFKAAKTATADVEEDFGKWAGS